MNLERMSVDELSMRCADEKKNDTSHEDYCVELFRRAITQNDQVCWEKIVNHNFGKQVTGWVWKANPPEIYPVEDYVQTTFARFATKYTTKKLKRAKRLQSILLYLKSVTRSVVEDARREWERQVKERAWEMEQEEVIADTPVDFAESVDFESLLTVILACCKTEQEKAIVNLKYRNDKTPKEIFALRSDLFANAASVSSVHDTLKRRLERDPKLRLMSGKA